MIRCISCVEEILPHMYYSDMLLCRNTACQFYWCFGIQKLNICHEFNIPYILSNHAYNRCSYKEWYIQSTKNSDYYRIVGVRDPHDV
jgi:hypothetical protein